jgi:hypothetical protein
MPVVFEAAAPDERQTLVQLHLQHPLRAQRVLSSRFLAPRATAAHDLSSRVTIVRKPPRTRMVRVIAFGRLSIFGPGATRLHDQLDLGGRPVAREW